MLNFDKKKQNEDVEGGDPFDKFYNSLLESGLTRKEIKKRVKNIIHKGDGAINKRLALLILTAEVSGTIECEIYDSGDDSIQNLSCTLRKKMDIQDWIEIGDAFYEEGIFWESMKYYDRVLNEYPEFVQIWKKMGNCFLKIGEYDEANMCYSMAHEPEVDLKEIYEEMNNTFNDDEEEEEEE